MKFLLTFALFLNTAVAAQCPSNTLPFSENTQPRLISKNFLFLEGPTWADITQSFYFSEMNFSGSHAKGPRAKIYRLTLPNTVTEFIGNSGSNGLFAQGHAIYAATHGSQSVSHFDLTSKTNTILADKYNGQRFNSPNDLIRHSQGHIFFTDPNWQQGDRPSETGVTGVYRMDVNGTVSRIDASLKNPNGILLSGDERTLYVGALDGSVYQYPLSSNGTLKGKRSLFAHVDVPDGMALDCAANVYITSHSEGAIYVFSKRGKPIQTLTVGPNTTNVAFGGKQHKQLLITTAKGLFIMPTNVPGFRRPGLGYNALE